MYEIITFLLFLGIFALFAWRQRMGAVALVTLLLPTYLFRITVFEIPFTYLEGMIIMLFVIFILQDYKKIALRWSRYVWGMLALLVVATISVFVAPNTMAALGIWKAYFVEPLLFFLVAINTIKTRRDFMLVVHALGLSALGISIVAIYQKFTGAFIPNPLWQAAETRRVTSVYGYPNAVGLYLAPIVVLYAAMCWQQVKKVWQTAQHAGWWPKVFLNTYYLSVWGLGLLAIWFAQSEGALVAVGASLLLYGLLRKDLRVATLIVSVVAVLSIVFMPALNSFVVEKATFSDFSGGIRVVIWQETIQLLKDNPVLGAGLAGYQTAIEPYHHAFREFEIYLYPHHVILNFWVELGVFGLLFMLWLILQFFTGITHVKKEGNRLWYLALIAMFTAMLVHGLVDVPYFKNDLAVLWWLVFALSYVLQKEKKLFE
jgi:O-antigen ligase